MTDESGKSKLIIDEDWKSQVEAEKAAASQQREEKRSPSAAQASESVNPDAGPDATHDAAQGAAPEGDLPPPTLSSLVITLATQSMAAMGLMAGPDGNPLPVELDHAKYLIDTIGMLDAKTAGNRTAEESALFEDALHQLRMTFVSVGKGA
ncbi:MAG: DUF1844 domain-containing protein [Pirellulales bacterium]